MGAILWDFYRIVVHNLIQLYIFIIIVDVILSWLVSFNVVNTRNQFVAMVGRITYQATEPALRPIRSILPSLGGLDLSPIILILGLSFLDSVLGRFFYSLAVQGM